MATDTTSELEARAAFERNPYPDLPWIRIRDDGIAIATGYSEALHRLLRWVPKAQWRASERCWHVPYSGAEAVRAVLPEITRLAEAARDLDDPGVHDPVARPATIGLIEIFAEAATLAHGPDWRAALVRDHPGSRIVDWIEGRSAPDPSDPLLTSLVAGLREKASAFVTAAERLEAKLAAIRGTERT